MFMQRQNYIKDTKKKTSPKFSIQNKYASNLIKNLPSHQRSSSLSRNKKIRLYTDYTDSDTYNCPILNKKFKPVLHSKRRDTCGIQINPVYNDKNRAVHSTKNNPKKNNDIRNLFKNENIGKVKKNNNKHPLMKFVSKNKNHLKYYESPYNKQLVSKFEYSTRSKLEISKKKHKRENISLEKNQIRLKTAQQIKRKQQQEQSTVKTIKKKEVKTLHEQHFKGVQNQKQETQSEDDSYEITQDQLETFGNRFPYGFQKIKLLGRGGFSLVWLGKHIKSSKQFAIKQIITQNTHQTHIKQIWFGSMFFTLGGIPKPEFSAYSGLKNLVRLYSYEINQTDTWIFYEKCGNSLGNTLYDIRSQRVYGNEKLYKIFYKPIYHAMAKNPYLLQKITIQICKTLSLLNACQVVHSDLKTENILIRYNQQLNFQINQVKLIDYGSSFEFKNISQFSMATPQYMPPEILNYIIHENDGQYEQQLYQKVMNNYNNPSAIDMWSLGCVLMQIIVGIPLWMSLPLLVPNKDNKSYLHKEGLFAVKGRLFPQIITKQRQVVQHLEQILRNNNYSRIIPSIKFSKVIKGMLQIDFNQRIKPNEAIKLLLQS